MCTRVLRVSAGDSIPVMTEAVIEAGMDVTNEPGVYVEGSHGIRTENVMVAQKWGKERMTASLCILTP